MPQERILVLDDEETIRFVLKTVIAGTGHDIVAVGTVREALALIAQERFAAAMLDLVLPDGSGIKVLEAIKQASPDTEVVIMTSHASVETAVNAIRMGAYDYVHKPFDIDVVTATVKRALEKRGLSLSNRQLLGQLEQHNRELAFAVKRLASLNAAGSGMGGLLDPQDVLEFFLRLVVRELDVERASVMLLDEGALKIAASHGIDAAIARNTRVAVGEGISGRVVLTGEPILVSDISNDDALRELPRQAMSNSFMSAPITLAVPIKSDAVIGVINVTNRRSGEPFDREDMLFLGGLAGQAAVAIERARHLQGLRDAIETLTSKEEQVEVANRQLRDANARLEESSRLKSEFLANTSHELRTPLNGVIGFLQVVLDGLCDSPEEQQDLLGRALECSRHLLGLINDVLDIAKIEAGRLTLETVAVSIPDVFQDVRNVTQVQAERKGVMLVFEPAGPFETAVRGDAGKVKQVLVNLVGNSLKFTEHGSIVVRAQAYPDRGHVLFEVIDTGIGIPPEQQSIVFEKFRQGDGSTTRRYGGTGLGLAICRNLIELMGGVIGVDSDGAGHGTRMYFSLPVWSEQAATPADDAAAETIAGPSGGALVLIVDDDAVFRQFVVALLHRNGYRTAQAAHAEQGWMLVRRLQPALVLIDYALPGPEGATLRTGWDLAQRMAIEPDTRHVPAIFLTGFDGELRARISQAKHARHPVCLQKPVDGHELLRRIEALVGADARGQLRVLLADDDPTMSVYLRKILPASRVHLEVANDGEECLQILRAQPRGFDVLLLDLMMPNVSGYDVLREMTMTGMSPDLPVMVLSNYPEPNDEEERQLLAGAEVVAVVAKSELHAEHELLSRLIERHLAARRAATGVDANGAAGQQREAA